MVGEIKREQTREEEVNEQLERYGEVGLRFGFEQDFDEFVGRGDHNYFQPEREPLSSTDAAIASMMQGRGTNPRTPAQLEEDDRLREQLLTPRRRVKQGGNRSVFATKEGRLGDDTLRKLGKKRIRNSR